LPIRIVCGPTQRESDGLALSSRNQYLTETERAIAPRLYAELSAIGKKLQEGNDHYGEIEKDAFDALLAAGFEPEYVSIRRAENLGVPDRDTDELVVLAAARLGKARLIDNIVVSV
jgi:pantoate--beta-alanine ligase